METFSFLSSCISFGAFFGSSLTGFFEVEDFSSFFSVIAVVGCFAEILSSVFLDLSTLGAGTLAVDCTEVVLRFS